LPQLEFQVSRIRSTFWPRIPGSLGYRPAGGSSGGAAPLDPVLQRLRFTVDTNEIFAQWCELQTSDICNWSSEGISDSGVYTVGNSMTGQSQVISDCSEYYLCTIFRPCACAANRCCELPTVSPLSFDMQVDGTHIDGSVVGLGNGPTNIHFVQTPEPGDASAD
jgi:hypothetical protein